MSKQESKQESCVVKTHLSSCLVDNLGTLIYLTSPNAYVHAVYKNAKPDLMKALAECAHNALYGDMEFTADERTTLKSLVQPLVQVSKQRRINPAALPSLLEPILNHVCCSEDSTK